MQEEVKLLEDILKIEEEMKNYNEERAIQLILRVRSEYRSVEQILNRCSEKILIQGITPIVKKNLEFEFVRLIMMYKKKYSKNTQSNQTNY